MVINSKPRKARNKFLSNNNSSRFDEKDRKDRYLRSKEAGKLTQSSQDGGRPKDLPHEGWDEEEAAHPFSELLLERIQHRHESLTPHAVSEKDAACRRKDRNQQKSACIIIWDEFALKLRSLILF